MSLSEPFREGDALLIVDVQNDFCKGGALAIPDGDAVVPVLNKWIDAAEAADIPIYASRDWHPKKHVSFESQDGPWPPHCIQDSNGAEFHPGLRLPKRTVKISKGVRFDFDQNSAFHETGLAEWLKKHHIKRLFVGGLAEDICVLATVLDGREAGFEMVLIKEATRGTNNEAGEEALGEMIAAGAEIAQ